MSDINDVKRFAIAALRRASYRWPPRDMAMRKARVERGIYMCNCCNGLFGRKEVQMDHINPIVPVEGWDSWDGLIVRLLCTEDLIQCLCKSCHKSKTFLENELRKQYKIPSIKKKKVK